MAQSNMTNTPQDDQDTSEFLRPAILERITDLRKRFEDATAELTALLEDIEPQNTEVKRQVHLCLQEAAHNLEQALDQVEDAESAAVGTLEPED
jgi:hypothetical protein